MINILMPKNKKAKKKYNTGTFWFLAIIVVSIIGAATTGSRAIVWSIIGICGAIVAYKNIQKREEMSFLIASSSLLIVMMAFMLISDFQGAMFPLLRGFLINIMVGFGVADFVVALGLLSKICLD
jgi:hypothetical protein